MKILITFLTVWAMTIATAKSQSFTVTDVETSMRDYETKAVERYIGKPMTLKFYDNIVSISVNGQKPINMRITDQGTYTASEPRDKENTMLYNLKLNKLAAYIRSVEFVFTISENASPYRRLVTTLTAKRN